MLRVRAAAVAVVGALVACATILAAPAVAAETTISFDNLPSGTALTNQYSGQGVTFGNADGLGRPANNGVFASHDANQIGANVVGVFCGEVCDTDTWMVFSTEPQNVSVLVASTTSGSFPMTMVAFDAEGNQVASSTTTALAGSFANRLGVTASGNDPIAFVDIQAGTNNPLYELDNLTFGSPGPPKPDFSLSSSGPVTVLAGNSVTATVTVHRYNNFNGPISLSYSGGPAGVIPSGPGGFSGADGGTFTVTLTANANAPASFNTPITVAGIGNEGRIAHSLLIPVAVSGTYDLRAQGLYVTQGIQNDLGGLLPSGIDSSGETYTHQGWVHLIAGKTTVVRLYADAYGAPPGGVPGVEAVLHVYYNGHEVPWSPLHPDYGPSSLPDTHEAYPAPVIDSELESDSNAYTFTIPGFQVNGTLTFVGQLEQTSQSFTGQPYIECQSQLCQSDNSFTLNDVEFNPTREFILNTLQLTVSGQPNPLPADQVFAYTKAVTPLADSGFIVLPYATTINTSSCLSNGFQCFYGSPLFLVSLWDFENGSQYDGLAGIGSGGFRGFTACNGCRDTATNYANQRWLTAVAHEIFHQFGLPHASNECAGGQDNDADDQGQTGEPWSPAIPYNKEPQTPADDGIGQLDGVALDTTKEPYQFRADPLAFSPHIDFMSYCNVFNNINDANMWVSPRNWEAVYSHFATSGGAADIAHATHQRPLRALAKVDAKHLRVVAVATAHGAAIVSVGPQVGPPPTASAVPLTSSTFTLTARGAGKRETAQTPMQMSAGHIDQLGPAALITAEVPAVGVDSIQIADNGTIVASRTRPAHAPKVKVLAPKAGSHVGNGHTVFVKWSATNPQHLSLTASVDYSGDGGHSWRTIFAGPNPGHVNLPSFYFADSGKAQIRVRINDGFNETSATSGAFTALGSPPVVSILTPANGASFAGDGAITLTGQAYDDSLSPLSGKSLVWTSGGSVIGHGATVTATGLPPGTDRITLTARDTHKHEAGTSVVVHVRAVKLRFLDLLIPSSIGTKATVLQMLARSTIPATLSVAGKRSTLGTKAKPISFSIPTGSLPLTVHVSVTALGVTYQLTYVVRRIPSLPNPPHPPPCGTHCV